MTPLASIFLISVFQKLLADKLSSIEKNKSDLITLVKQTSGKLKFTLNGSVAKDTDFVKMSLESSRSRLSVIEQGILEAVSVLNKASNENPEINVICWNYIFNI